MTDEVSATGTAEILDELARVRMEHVELVLALTKDRHKLFASASCIEDGENASVTPHALLEQIGKYANLSLVNERVVEELVTRLQEDGQASSRRIAKGEAPKPGRAGRLVYLVKRYQPGKKREGVDYVDPRCIRLFDNVESGTVVARMYPPHPGIAGRDALGHTVQAEPVEPYALKHDQSVRLEETSKGYQQIIAAHSGYLTDSDGVLRVEHTLVLKGDVDISTGDIDFVGDIQISGDVMKDYSVRGRGDVLISGNVVGGSVTSEQGSIEIAGDVAGSEAIEISTGSDPTTSEVVEGMLTSSRCHLGAMNEIRVRTVHGAFVEAGGSVHVSKELRQTVLRSRGIVHMPDAHLLGGETYTACGLEASIIGSDGGSSTYIAICSDVESSAEYAEILGLAQAHEHAAQMLRLHLGPYASEQKKIDDTDSEHQLKIEVLRKKLAQVERGYAALEEKRAALLEGAVYNSTFRVNFERWLYQGVSIEAGTARLDIKESVRGPGTVEYDPVAEGFQTGDLKALECVFEGIEK